MATKLAGRGGEVGGPCLKQVQYNVQDAYSITCDEKAVNRKLDIYEFSKKRTNNYNSFPVCENML